MQSGGTNNITNYLYLTYNRGSSGTYNLSGGYLSDSYENVAGNFLQSGGTNSIVNNLTVQSGCASKAAYNLSGGYLCCSSEYVGSSGTGNFVQSGGTNSIANSLCIGGNTGASGTYNLSGGLLKMAGVVAGTCAATFNFNGGTLQAGGDNPTFFSGLTAANVQSGGAIIDVQRFSVTVAQNLFHDPSLVNVRRRFHQARLRRPDIDGHEYLHGRH